MFWRKKRPSNDFADEIHSHLAHEADDLQQSDEKAPMPKPPRIERLETSP